MRVRMTGAQRADVLVLLLQAVRHPEDMTKDACVELLAMAHEAVSHERDQAAIERIWRHRAEAHAGGKLVPVGNAHRTADGKDWVVHSRHSLHMQDQQCFVVEVDGG